MNKDKYEITDKYVYINIEKPVYGSYVYIRDKYLDHAIAHKIPLRIEIPQGIYIIDPKVWIKTGEKIEKVFLIPEHPMKLYGNHVLKYGKKIEKVPDIPKANYDEYINSAHKLQKLWKTVQKKKNLG